MRFLQPSGLAAAKPKSPVFKAEMTKPARARGLSQGEM
jgi:hypothetical protein